MISGSNGKFRVDVAMTLTNAPRLLKEGRPLLGGGDITFDLGLVTELDSSGLAVLLDWTRTAAARGGVVHCVQAPPNLRSLADLYGVGGLLPGLE